MSVRLEAARPAEATREPPRPAPPCALVVFGASGDLTHRKLVPALYHLDAAGLLPPAFATVGVARRGWNDAQFRAAMKAAVIEHGRGPFDERTWQRFERRLAYVSGAFEDPATCRRLGERLAELDRALGLEGNRLFYLATPPGEFAAILAHMRGAGLVRHPGGVPWTRVVVEKPFGRDLASARELNALVSGVLDESQVFRIDHYLGKETVQNLLVFRFGNTIFEPLWNRSHVDHVEITVAETLGVGTRGRFYESTGVLRDVVQNHLLELLALVAMEPPIGGDGDEIRAEKLKVLRALRELTPDRMDLDVVLGQYRGYRDEPDVAGDSNTATFAALRLFVDNWRWHGVPFYLRTGKRLAKRATEISLHFRTIPLCLFGDREVCERIEPNVLAIRIQPDEGISLRFASKVPGHDLEVRSVVMDMSYHETFGGEPPEAYERLLLDAMRGDPTLFSRRDAVETSWAWITPVIEHFERKPDAEPARYEPGSWGPDEAGRLLARDVRHWRVP